MVWVVFQHTTLAHFMIEGRRNGKMHQDILDKNTGVIYQVDDNETRVAVSGRQ